MRKAFEVHPKWRGARVPGQVPTRDPGARAIMALATAPARPRDLLSHTEPRLTVSSVIRNLGLPWDQEKAWQAFLKEVCQARTEVEVRQALFNKFQTDGTEPALRHAILQRTLVHFRGMQKSMTRIVTPSDLKKAEARGGKYYRRVPHESGKGHRYIYDPDKYNSRDDAHVSGEEVSKKRVHADIQKHLEAAADKGCAPVDFKPLIEKHGHEKIADTLRDRVHKGDSHFHNGRFYHEAPAGKQATSKRQPDESRNGHVHRFYTQKHDNQKAAGDAIKPKKKEDE